MSIRNFNNVTTLGALTGPVTSGTTTLAVTNFTQYPTTPFTATIDRNTATEEIVLVTGVAGATLTVQRGFDNTAAIAHLAGASVEHTAVALDFAEANSHLNAGSNVHGVAGSLVGTEGVQTILDKSFVGNVHLADTTEGDAVVAVIPTGATARNLFRGVGVDGADKAVVDSSGNATFAGHSVTGIDTRLTAAEVTLAAATANPTANAVVRRDATGRAQVATPTAGNDAATKTYTDNGDTAARAYTDTSITALNAVAAATANAVVKRDTSARAQFADPVAGADAATKTYVDNGASTAWVAATLINSWTNFGAPYQTARYRKLRNGQVELQGLVASGAVGTVVLQLPAGFRPAAQLPFAVIANANAAARIDVDASGNVTCTGLAAGANTAYLSINITFFADA
jgi:hypothetical protein